MAPLDGSFDSSGRVDYDDPTNDRFTTSWSGPYDPRALQYAAENGISYDEGNGGATCMFTRF